MGVHWKIQFLGWGGLTKNQHIGGHGLKRGWGSLGHFVDLGGGLGKKERYGVFEGCWYPNACYDSNLKNKSKWALFYLLLQILTNWFKLQMLKFMDDKIISLTCFINILRIYMNEKLDFYHHILVRNAQMYIRIENLVY